MKIRFSFIHACMHAYIHKYTNINTHTCIHTYGGLRQSRLNQKVCPQIPLLFFNSCTDTHTSPAGLTCPVRTAASIFGSIISSADIESPRLNDCECSICPLSSSAPPKKTHTNTASYVWLSKPRAWQQRDKPFWTIRHAEHVTTPSCTRSKATRTSCRHIHDRSDVCPLNVFVVVIRHFHRRSERGVVFISCFLACICKPVCLDNVQKNKSCERESKRCGIGAE